MREIKFRAFMKELGTMHTVLELHNDGGVMVDGYKYPFGHEYLLKSDYIFLMQYTGLKDKNCVEIYEGDIVDCYWLAELGVCEIDCQHKGVVRFVDCRFEVSFSDKAFIRNIGEDGVYSATELELTCMSHDDDYAVEYEVIGNIYENPELLKAPN